MMAIEQARTLRPTGRWDDSCPRVVLDTNVVLDWLVFHDPHVQPLRLAIEAGRLRWLACAGMREELARMLSHRSLERWQPDALPALAVFDQHVQQHAQPAPCTLRCSDADDQAFIDLAVAVRAEWLFTHDRALLGLARRARLLGVSVLPPSRWAGTPL